MHPESHNIIERYERRKSARPSSNRKHESYVAHMKEERETLYAAVLNAVFSDISSLRLLEIGAGSGDNLFAFHAMGIPFEHLEGNELIEERCEAFSQRLPHVTLHRGDAIELPASLNGRYDVVFQSTVFTSILDGQFRKELAARMWKLLKPGGVLLWYDFVYDNPSNRDVKGIPKRESISLFPEGELVFSQKVTLAPPLGRRVGNWYKFLNRFSFLRTHVILAMRKNS